MQEIDKLRINKSPIVDEVFPCVLKECKNTISIALPDIFIKLIALGDVSSLWRQINVIPTFKKGYCNVGGGKCARQQGPYGTLRRVIKA